MLYFTYITIVYHVPSGLIAYLTLFVVVVGGDLHTRSTVILRDYTMPGIYMRQIDNVPWLVAFVGFTTSRYERNYQRPKRNPTKFFEQCMITGSDLQYYPRDALAKSGDLKSFIWAQSMR